MDETSGLSPHLERINRSLQQLIIMMIFSIALAGIQLGLVLAIVVLVFRRGG